jgi:hypothetical protein
MTFQRPVTSTQRGTRNPATKLIVPFMRLLCGTSGSVAPDGAVVVSNWIRFQAGGICNLKLHVSQLAGTIQGTLDVCVETASNPYDPVTNPRGNAAESPRPLLQQFDSIAGTIAPPAFVESFLTAPSDGWIRVAVTPGQSAGQLCNWQITGNCYHGGTRNPV